MNLVDSVIVVATVILLAVLMGACGNDDHKYTNGVPPIAFESAQSVCATFGGVKNLYVYDGADRADDGRYYRRAEVACNGNVTIKFQFVQP